MSRDAFRGYDLGQSNFATDAAMDELLRKLGADPSNFVAAMW